MNYTEPTHIPGWIDARQCKLLTETVQCLPAESKILEIGVGLGRSSWAIIDGLDPSHSLVSVDTFAMNEPDLKHINIRELNRFCGESQQITQLINTYRRTNQRTTYRQALSYHPKRSKINHTIVTAYSAEFLESNNTTWDLAYIDGDHDPITVRHELDHLNTTAILCGDDYIEIKPTLMSFLDDNPQYQLTEYKSSHNNNFWCMHINT